MNPSACTTAPRNRLGFAYQRGFVRLLHRFPRQTPFEVLDEWVTFAAVQLGLCASLITSYQQRQQTVSEHQQQLTAYLELRTMGEEETCLELAGVLLHLQRRR